MLPPLSALSPAPPAGRGARTDPARGDRPGGGDGREVRAGGGERALLTRGPGLAGSLADAPARRWRAHRRIVEAAAASPGAGRDPIALLRAPDGRRVHARRGFQLPTSFVRGAGWGS